MPADIKNLCSRGVIACCLRSVMPCGEDLPGANTGQLSAPVLAEGLPLEKRLASLRPRRFSNRPGYANVGLTLENLRLACPPAFPVVLRAGVTAPGIDGYCYRRGGKFNILIDHKLSCEGVLNTLLHEWGHALAWNCQLEKAGEDLAAGAITAEKFEEIAHGPEFGVSFAAVWRVFVKKILPVLNSHASWGR